MNSVWEILFSVSACEHLHRNGQLFHEHAATDFLHCARGTHRLSSVRFLRGLGNLSQRKSKVPSNRTHTHQAQKPIMCTFCTWRDENKFQYLRCRFCALFAASSDRRIPPQKQPTPPSPHCPCSSKSNSVRFSKHRLFSSQPRSLQNLRIQLFNIPAPYISFCTLNLSFYISLCLQLFSSTINLQF